MNRLSQWYETNYGFIRCYRSPVLRQISFFSCNQGKWLRRLDGTRSCRFSWLKIILMALWNWTPSVAAGRKNEQRGNRPRRLSQTRNDRTKITSCAFWQNNSTIWLPSWIFINSSLFDVLPYKMSSRKKK